MSLFISRSKLVKTSSVCMSTVPGLRKDLHPADLPSGRSTLPSNLYFQIQPSVRRNTIKSRIQLSKSALLQKLEGKWKVFSPRLWLNMRQIWDNKLVLFHTFPTIWSYCKPKVHLQYFHLPAIGGSIIYTAVAIIPIYFLGVQVDGALRLPYVFY